MTVLLLHHTSFEPVFRTTAIIFVRVKGKSQGSIEEHELLQCQRASEGDGRSELTDLLCYIHELLDVSG